MKHIFIKLSPLMPIFMLTKSKSKLWSLGDSIKWNFTKFLVDAKGQPIKRYGPMDDPIPKASTNLQLRILIAYHSTFERFLR